MPSFKITNSTILFVLIIVISSCGSNNESSNLGNETETVLNDTVTSYSGYWATEKYISVLKETKSPSKSRAKQDFFKIPKSYKDVAPTTIYHEYGIDAYVLKHKSSYFFKDYYSVTHPGSSGNNDSTEVFFSDKGNKMKVKEGVYVRIPENNGIIEEIVFKGQYKSDGKSVTFDGNGTIAGLDSVHFYKASIDPYYNMGNTDDIIHFGKTKEEMLMHCYEFKGDTLLIYAIDCLSWKEDVGDCSKPQKGKLKWTLIKE
ncbi:MAG: hypothetical protein V4511_04035 [Bacteroidota bacterium]